MVTAARELPAVRSELLRLCWKRSAKRAIFAPLAWMPTDFDEMLYSGAARS
ncbi:hypothetical protein [Azohydromonas australica]|uniref:hypothetical protein n=1 Tax=Azohydromonas australica TaxID=364039 RepID=UPI0004078106|nr:hypothetical protein [Azohydromonas australica]